MTGAAPLLQVAELPTLTQPVVTGVAIAYFAVVAAIGAWAARRTRSARDFFVAGQGIGLWTLAIASMAATISGFAFIGGPGLTYSIGLTAVYIVLPASITGSVSTWVLGKRLRLLAEIRPMITVPDAIGARFRSPAAQGLAGLAIAIAVIGYTATNLLALGVVIKAVFGTSLTIGIVFGTVITLAYSASGGILAGVYTDLFQGMVMAVASVLVFLYVLMVAGGLGGITERILPVDPTFLSPWGKLGPMAALSFFFVFGIGTLGQPHVLHKLFMLRDPRRLKWTPLLTTGALMLTLLLYFGVGLATKGLVANGQMAALASPDDATPMFLLRFTPVLLSAIVFAGVAAAIMSTVNSFLSIGAAALTHDLPHALGRRLPDELRIGRLTTAAIALVAAGVATLSGTLVAFLGIFGFGLFASTLVPSLAVGLNWAGATRAGAVASIATGLVATLLCETLGYLKVFTLPTGVSVSGLSLVLSLLVFVVVSWFTRSEAARDLDPDVRVVLDA
ncbi:MAG: Osmoregulated proline transporter OpuE [Gemmatimonadaceae bacterium]|nr:Osmoregulated proline transporter OpuE [Gemmatimonadaceae bacterium]